MTLYSEHLNQEKKNFLSQINNDIWFQSKHYFKLNTVNKAPQLELIITPYCNQSCEYCYLQKNKNSLDPKYNSVTKQEILNNLKLILDYFIYEEKKFFVNYELFAGDIFYNNYFFDIMDIMYPYFDFMYSKAPELFKEFAPTITIPSNLRFVENDDTVNKVLNITNRYKQVNTKVVFSWSSDGKYSVEHREKTELSNEYWEKCFNFCKITDSGIHCMISPNNVGNAIKNYQWWKDQIYKHMPERAANDYTPYFLEVRDSNWTEGAIIKYLDFLNFVFLDCFENNNKNPFKMAYSLFVGDGQYNTIKNKDNNIINFFNCINSLNNSDTIACSLQNSTVIRLSDLSLVPCHRTSYNLFSCGQFVVEQNKIIDFTPANYEQYVNLKFFKTNFAPECCVCWNNQTCIKGCLGSQYEYSGEIYLPIPNVCTLLKAKTSQCLRLLVEHNILLTAIEHKIINEDLAEHLLKLASMLGVI